MYTHHHSWLQFAALALTLANSINEPNKSGKYYFILFSFEWYEDDKIKRGPGIWFLLNSFTFCVFLINFFYGCNRDVFESLSGFLAEVRECA